MPDTLWWIAGLCAVLGVMAFIAAVLALWRRRPLRMSLRLLWALAFLSLGAALGAIGLGVQGYRALTREEVAVVVQTEPTAPKRFRALLTFPDGRTLTYALTGDSLYVDAHILKWQPWANILGLHTAYELDRVTGRYNDLAEEKQGPRTVFSLAPERPVDLFNLRQRYTLLRPLLDAEYGSATFVAADAPATYELRVSTAGLLARRIAP